MKEHDIIIVKKRKKLWDTFNWVYKGKGYLRKNHSLNLYNTIDKMKTYFRRYENKQNRLRERLKTKKESLYERPY